MSSDDLRSQMNAALHHFDMSDSYVDDVLDRLMPIIGPATTEDGNLRARIESLTNDWLPWLQTKNGEALIRKLRALAAYPTPEAGGGVTTHELKTWPEFWPAVENGDKAFEVRRDDRGFKVGDLLRLREWNWRPSDLDSMPIGYSGREITRRITYILHGLACPAHAIADGFVVLGLADLDDKADE